MKRIVLFSVLLLLPSATLCAQSIGKSLTFAQIAGGGLLESIINVTNRGTTTYTGSLSLFTMASDGSTPLPWNPVVNGTAITNGQVAITIFPGNTQKLIITAPSLQAGFGTITPTALSDMDDTSFVEGALTYYFLSGNAIVDSVGVEPSSQIYLTTIPFDDFSNIAIALANTNAATASVKLTVSSASNQVLGTTIVSLVRNAHLAKYLYEMFPGIPRNSAGRLDVETDIPIYGVALTQVGSQFSSLPFQPAVKTYSYTVIFQGTIKTGLLNTRFGGSLENFTTIALTPVHEAARYITGTSTSGTLSTIDYDLANNQLKYWSFSSYSFSAPMINGMVQIWTINPFTYLGQGTVTLIATN